MPTMGIEKRGSASPTLSCSSTRTPSGDNLIQTKKTMAAAKIGVLGVRTDNDTGSLTMNSGHGIQTGDKVCLFFEKTGGNGIFDGKRYDMTVGTVSGNTVPIDLGGGDNLPLANAAVHVMVENQETVGYVFDGTNLVSLLVGCDGGPFVVVFYSGATVVGVFKDVDQKAYGYVFDTIEVNNNPLLVAPTVFSGLNVTKVIMAHGDTAAAHDISIALIVN